MSHNNKEWQCSDKAKKLGSNNNQQIGGIWLWWVLVAVTGFDGSSGNGNGWLAVLVDSYGKLVVLAEAGGWLRQRQLASETAAGLSNDGDGG